MSDTKYILTFDDCYRIAQLTNLIKDKSIIETQIQAIKIQLELLNKDKNKKDSR